MSEIPNIRKATSQDIPYIYKLVKDLATFEGEPESVTASLEDYKKDFHSKKFDAFVATISGEIVGMAMYYDAYSSWRGRMLWLDDFIVLQEHRSKGIGDLLFETLLKFARDQGYSLMKWQVLDWNTRAQKFYDRKQAITEKNWWNVKIVF